MTVVTQFITNNNSPSGTLVDIRRIFIQDGKVIPNPPTNFPGIMPDYDSITEDFCTEQKNAFGDRNSFKDNGGLAAMGRSLAKGHVLALSIWNDHHARMLWLDSTYPTDADPNKPGIARGDCPTSSGDPSETESQYPNAQVVFSNIKVGDIGSTYSARG
jgi:cellulose 1,4-beta-cellobiosidase